MGYRCCRRLLRFWFFSLLSVLLFVAGQQALAQQASPRAQELLARHAAIQAQLATSPLGQPLLIDSEELPDGVRGEVFAELDQPFTQVTQALARPGNWCAMLLLHVNNRRCKLIRGDGAVPPTVELSVVRRWDLPVESAFILDMAMRVDSSAADYLMVDLRSADGPMGTRAHQVQVEAIALAGGSRTFLHFSYAYLHNTMARLASQAYLATFGRSKVGFTVVGDGPEYIRGLRGLVERNSMRYFLTVSAYLDAMRVPPAQQPDRRLENWFASAERFPRQLHEIDHATYVAIKRSDRQVAEASP